MCHRDTETQRSEREGWGLRFVGSPSFNLSASRKVKLQLALVWSSHFSVLAISEFKACHRKGFR